jgi:hypothetical protein
MLPYWGEDALPKSGVFANKDWEGQPFGGKGYKGAGGSAVEVSMYGGKGFHAFRLPAKGRLELDGYSIETNKDISGATVWEVQQLKVNGKTPLEKWLPYDTTCGKKVKIGWEMLTVDWKNLDWDREKLGSREDYPKEKVEDVRAEGIRSWSIKLPMKNEK